MPCIFCIAVFMLIAGALTAAQVDEVESKLADKAEGGSVRRTVDSESVAKFELSARVGDKAVPVAVTVFKEHGRVRIQVLTHELKPEEVEALEDELAEALGAEVVDRQDGSTEHAHDHPHEAPEPEAEKDKDKAKDKAAAPERPAERA
jgi:DNA-binding protein YbaB